MKGVFLVAILKNLALIAKALESSVPDMGMIGVSLL